MAVDEYKIVHLIDLLGCTQEECARQMGGVRTTVQAVYDSTRRKLAKTLVFACRLVVHGGDYVICHLPRAALAKVALPAGRHGRRLFLSAGWPRAACQRTGRGPVSQKEVF